MVGGQGHGHRAQHPQGSQGDAKPAAERTRNQDGDAQAEDRLGRIHVPDHALDERDEGDPDDAPDGEVEEALDRLEAMGPVEVCDDHAPVQHHDEPDCRGGVHVVGRPGPPRLDPALEQGGAGDEGADQQHLRDHVVDEHHGQHGQEEVACAVDQRIIVVLRREAVEEEPVEAHERDPAKLHDVVTVPPDGPGDRGEETHIVDQDADTGTR